MTPSPFARFLDANGAVILDGGLATELERRGANLNDPLWSARVLTDRPELIRDVHYDYFMAGADVAITATYQASLQGFARIGLDRAASKAMFRRAVSLANEARDAACSDEGFEEDRSRPLVAASIGSYGAYLADGSEYRGQYGVSTPVLTQFHRERLDVFAEFVDEFDCFAIETIPSFEECQVFVELLAEYALKPAWISFCCRDDSQIADGTPIAKCAAAVDSIENVFALGINCTAPRHVLALIECAKSSTTKTIIVYPNSGEGWDPGRRCWTPATPEDDILALAPAWREAGARGFGGCCRTTPALIAQLRDRLTREKV